MCWCTSVTLAPQDPRLEASKIQSQHLKTSTHMYAHRYEHMYICVCVYLHVCSFICDEFLYLFANLADILPNTAQGREGLSRFIAGGGEGVQLMVAGRSLQQAGKVSTLHSGHEWDPSLWNGAGHIYDGFP